MAEFDFPSAPTNGQQYTANGVTYTWNGYAWIGSLPVIPQVSGSWVRIQKTVVTTPLTQVTLAGINTNYSEYEVRLADVELDANLPLGFQISKDGGTTPVITNYQWEHSDFNSGAAATAVNNYTSTSATRTDKMPAGGFNNLGLAADEALDAVIRFVAPGAGKNPKFDCRGVYSDSSGNVRAGFGYGGHWTETTFNALIFAPWNAGNIRKGSFTLFGRIP